MNLPDLEVMRAIVNGVDAMTGADTSKDAWDFNAAKGILGCVALIGFGIWLTVVTNFGYVPGDVPLILRFIGPTIVLGISIVLWFGIRARIRMDRESRS